MPGVLLALLLLALVPLKAQFEFGLGPRAHDADYYYGVARHVSQGDGLQSNLSLYFQGFKSFPHRVTGSPVWPLTLGWAGGAFGLERMSRLLPELLYFVDLWLLYFLALRLWRRIAPGGQGLLFRESRLVNIGHVAVLLFATNIRFFRFTSVPNNEAMSFFWIFSALLVLDRAVEERSPLWSGAAGLLATLGLRTRVQARAVPIAIVGAFLFVAASDRRGLRMAGAAVVGALLPVIPWVIYLASWSGGLSVPSLLGMESQYETPELGVLSHTISLPGFWATVQDRLGGLAVAFDPTSSKSYVHHFNAAAYLVPLAALLAGVQALRRFEVAVPEPRGALVVAVLLVGLGMLGPVHMSHMAFSKSWLFGFRHGLPLLFLILPALAYLDAHASRAWQLLTAAILALSLVMNVADMRELFDTKFRTGMRPVEAQLVKWLDAQRPLPAVVTTRPWELATYSRAGYHWILCKSDPMQTLRLLNQAGADFVVVFDRDRTCPFAMGLYPERLKVIRVFGNDEAYLLAPRAHSAAEVQVAPPRAPVQ
jgi:hypothetical protein